jgi:hypothetical protein
MRNSIPSRDVCRECDIAIGALAVRKQRIIHGGWMNEGKIETREDESPRILFDHANLEFLREKFYRTTSNDEQQAD